MTSSSILRGSEIHVRTIVWTDEICHLSATINWVIALRVLPRHFKSRLSTNVLLNNRPSGTGK